MGRAVVSVLIIVILVVAGGAVYLLFLTGGGNTTTSSTTSGNSSSSTSSTSSTTSTSTTSSTSGHVSPNSITYETLQTIQFLDPHVSYDIYGASIEQNIYEPVFYFNGTSQTPIPWLAHDYTLSADGKTMQITLRSGIKFADGETLNA
ncbi:MAG TPA: ABC transporter substrate-binding protein, partial [Nitrososphaerales archaeon]|nr:ABC transporter substrate-binding protein [Nitrososphaerales archaeon]